MIFIKENIFLLFKLDIFIQNLKDFVLATANYFLMMKYFSILCHQPYNQPVNKSQTTRALPQVLWLRKMAGKREQVWQP